MKTWVLKNLFSLPNSKFPVGKNFLDIPQCLALGQPCIVSFFSKYMLMEFCLLPNTRTLKFILGNPYTYHLLAKMYNAYTDKSVSSFLKI